MAERVHHINFIVRDLNAAIPVYERILNMPVTARDALEERGVIAARFKVGETWIVLVQPTKPDTIPARFLEENGEGFFLMSLEVGSLDDEIRRLGADAFAGPIRRGAENWQVVDLDSAGTFDAQLQFIVEDDSETSGG